MYLVRTSRGKWGATERRWGWFIEKRKIPKFFLFMRNFFRLTNLMEQKNRIPSLVTVPTGWSMCYARQFRRRRSKILIDLFNKMCAWNHYVYCVPSSIGPFRFSDLHHRSQRRRRQWHNFKWATLVSFAFCDINDTQVTIGKILSTLFI